MFWSCELRNKVDLTLRKEKKERELLVSWILTFLKEKDEKETLLFFKKNKIYELDDVFPFSYNELRILETF